MRNAIFRRESREYYQKIFRLIKDVEMIFVKNQLNIIYNDFDIKFHRDLKKFEKVIIMNSFLINLDDCKYIW